MPVSTTAQVRPAQLGAGRPAYPTSMHPVAHQQRANYFRGYYNQRHYNYMYGVNRAQSQTPHQFSKTAEAEMKMRPVYLGIAAVAIIFGIVMIATAFMQPKLDPDLRAEIQTSPTTPIRAVVFCENCKTQLEGVGLTVIATYPAQSAVLIMGKGSEIGKLEDQPWVTRIGKPT